MKIATVILAGGAGSRIGGAKPLRTLGGLTLIDRAAARARGWSGQVVAAVRDPSQLGSSDIEHFRDEPSIEGPLAGLAAALRFALHEGFEGVLVIPADMPFLPNDLRDRLERTIGAHVAAIASSAGRLHPVCGLWRIQAVDRLASYLETGKRSLIGFAEAVDYAVAEWPAMPADPFFNINSAEDLVAAEQRLSA